MEKKVYQTIVDKHKPKENRFMNAVIAFLIGGSIGVIAQLLIEFYSSCLEISTKDASFALNHPTWKMGAKITVDIEKNRYKIKCFCF